MGAFLFQKIQSRHKSVCFTKLLTIQINNDNINGIYFLRVTKCLYQTQKAKF